MLGAARRGFGGQLRCSRHAYTTIPSAPSSSVGAAMKAQPLDPQEFRAVNLEEVEFRQPVFLNEQVDTKRRRLGYQASKRGMLEMDNLFGAFAYRHLETMDGGQLAELDAILRETDVDLHAWLVKGLPGPDHITGLTTYQRLLAMAMSGEVKEVRDHLIGL
eukprot:TRINITY_DN3201_c0_g1_i1.p2 TRINITY_DN3201_c0_g1~~TRINITY_DN3201_c0_g1_i1.p2  ORF type:complete len:168 (+),score=60.05 TRINITY_DN3201_c0_g1_i1:23-505(+)